MGNIRYTIKKYGINSSFSIRKFGIYKLKKKDDELILELKAKLTYINNEYNNLKKELIKDKYPNGGVVYFLDYSQNDKESVYRLGMTYNMKNRKNVHDSHSYKKRKIIKMIETKCPIKLESCLRSMLYDYRYENKKDTFICNIKKITEAIKKCLDGFNCVSQKGGYFSNEISQIKQKIAILNKKILKYNKLLE